MTRLTVLALMLASATLAAPVPKVKLQGDVLLLQGSWDWDPAVKQPLINPQIDTERVVIKDNALVIHYRHKVDTWTSETEFTLDPSADPKTIDFTPTTGANQGKTYLGRYEIKDGKLRICYRGPGSTRPTGFDDKGNGNAGTTTLHLVPSAKK